MIAGEAPSAAPAPARGEAAGPAPRGPGTDAPRVAVCVATCRRPRGLARLLASLAAMERNPGEPAPLVVVVDNDGEGSAAPVVRDAAFPFEIRYAVEPERNISLARNRGVALALEHGAECIAFVDDDETVPPDWLRVLLRARARYGADVVVGPVLPEYPAGTPRWLADGRFFGGPVPPSGTRLTGAHTSNVLLDAGLLHGVDEPFDPRFGITGGGDSFLFMRLHRGGARIVFTADAPVHERIPASRARPRWVLRRAFRIGNTAVVCERALPAGRPVRRLARAALRMGWGAATLPFGALRGRGPALRALWNVAYGCGALAGALGIRYREYARLHGE